VPPCPSLATTKCVPCGETSVSASVTWPLCTVRRSVAHGPFLKKSKQGVWGWHRGMASLLQWTGRWCRLPFGESEGDTDALRTWNNFVWLASFAMLDVLGDLARCGSATYWRLRRRRRCI
jgi:hypothetical protein